MARLPAMVQIQLPGVGLPQNRAFDKPVCAEEAPDMSGHYTRIRDLAMAGMLAMMLWPGVAATRPAAKPSAQGPAAGVLLVARRDMLSQGFAQSVVLLIKHDARGTLGVVLNRRTRLTLKDVLPDLDAAQAARHALYLGGPVAPQSLTLLMRKEVLAEGVEPVTGEIVTSTHPDVLRSLMTRKKAPEDMRAFIGYAGWASGQLEGELARGAWHLAPSTTDLVFGDEAELWDTLIDKLEPPGIHVQAPLTPQRDAATRRMCARNSSSEVCRSSARSSTGRG